MRGREVVGVRAGSGERRGLVFAIAGAAILLRLPYLYAPTGADEGGYLAVARQWHQGSSLYGNYFVDRPPLLIMIFQLASVFDGIQALRVIAALGAAVAVLGVAYAARQLAGPRGAVVAALLAAALFVSPPLGTIQINGELLAAPFVAWAIALAVRALEDPEDVLAAAGVGALAVSALLIKQNLAEPIVFAGVAALVAWWLRELTGRALARLVGIAAAGALAVLSAVGGWTVLHGTSLKGVWDATYPFRLRAAHQLATFPDTGRAHRAAHFADVVITSGILAVLIAFIWSVVRRRARGPAAWGMLAALVWVSASILLSGGYWDHYLIEAVVPVAIAAGMSLGDAESLSWRKALLPLVAAAWVLVFAIANWSTGLGKSGSTRGTEIGAAIASVARPGDTLVSAFGDAEAVEAAGLASPYPYLWTLPAEVDDPHLVRLLRLLRGPAAPTWFVSWDRPAFPDPLLADLHTVVVGHYYPAGTVCGRTIYLLDGQTRQVPSSSTCSHPLALGDLR